MQVNIKDLTVKGITVQLKDKLDMSDLLGGRADIAGFGKLEADLQAEAKEGVAEVSGQLTLPIKLVCARCLTPIEETLTIPFREVFAKHSEDVPKEDEDETHITAADKVDLKPYVEEAVWLALPYVPLCREQCQGLCPVCGENRNEQACGCSTGRIDPRLAGLADLFKKDE